MMTFLKQVIDFDKMFIEWMTMRFCKQDMGSEVEILVCVLEMHLNYVVQQLLCRHD
jgi:hypothetical protein